MMKHRSLRSAAFFATAFAAIATASANASILTFDIANPALYAPITTYGTRINSLSDADGSYLQGNGFTPNIVTSYRTVFANGSNATFSNSVSWWGTGYGDLIRVAFPNSNGYLAEYSFTPDAGFGIRLNSFDIAGYLGTYFNQSLVIYDENYNVLLNYSPVTAPGTGHTTITPNLTHYGTIRIQFGPNWNTGIDNINFDQISSASVVPEPTTIASAGLAALVGLAALRRNRRLA